jgi:diacylglycerol kinase (ATP)
MAIPVSQNPVAGPRRLLFLVNPAADAGNAGGKWPEVQRRLRASGVEGDVALTTRPGEALELARARAGDYDAIVAVGGDGTAFEVVSGILSSTSPATNFGVFPAGTGNDIAVVLGVGHPRIAIETLAEGRARSFDAIRIDCFQDGRPLLRHALLFGGVGIVGESLKRTTGLVKKTFGQRLAYPIGVARALLSYRSPPMKVTLDQQLHTGRHLFVCASNSETSGGGMKLAPGARMDDGLLNVNRIDDVGRWAALWHLRRLCQGRHTTHPQVDYQTASTLAVEADVPLEVAADGELIGHTPARFTVQPAALRVLTPA